MTDSQRLLELLERLESDDTEEANAVYAEADAFALRDKLSVALRAQYRRAGLDLALARAERAILVARFSSLRELLSGDARESP